MVDNEATKECFQVNQREVGVAIEGLGKPYDCFIEPFTDLIEGGCLQSVPYAVAAEFV